jgi:hypothetical protein
MRGGRAVVIVVGMIAVIAIGVAGTAIVFQMRERDLRIQREGELRTLRIEKQELEQQVTTIQDAKERLESELTRATSELDQIALQVAEERDAKAALVKSIDERQREIDRLGKDAEQLKAERDQLAEQVTKLKSDQQGLQTQLSTLQQEKEELEIKLAEFSPQPTVELDRVVVTDPEASLGSLALTQPAGSQVSTVQGQVIVVNREYDFVVINLGRNQGLAVGQEFRVIRGERVMGRVKVEKIYDELSAAAILPDTDKDAIREGDLVRAI